MQATDKDKLFAVVDQGGHASRTVIMDASGRPLFLVRRPLSTSRPREGFVEHDPLGLVNSVKESLAEALRKAGKDSVRIVSTGLAAQRSTVACFSARTGEALTPVISWQDTRARDDIRKLAHCAGDIHRRTGLFLSPHYGASKLSWCLENIPAVRSSLQSGDLCFGPMISYLVRVLTGSSNYFSDPVSASRTLLWNIHDGDWDNYLLRLFHVPRKVLPVCVPSVGDFGDVQVEGRRIPLRLVTGDQSAALYAHGRLRTETAYVNIGTGAFLSRPLGQQPYMAPGLLTSVVHEQDGSREYVLEGTVNGAGSAIEWIRKAHKIENLWDLLPGWLEKSKDPPLFLNGISGLGSPYWIPDMEPSFIGDGPVPEKVVAVVESIAFLLYRNFVEMEDHFARPDRIQISGGLAALDGLCQILADLTRLPAYRPVHTEATARGVCYLLAGKPEHWPEPAPGTWFNPGDDKATIRRYARWVEAVEERVEREK